MGKLIASLRKKKNLTQSELGAMVGVGDRAVSKWERGITCPDISIINDLSKALGITSDELLAGELNDKELMQELTTNAQVNKFNIKFIILPIILILAFVGVLLYLNYSRSDVYTLDSLSDEYEVFGKVIFNRNKMTLIINEVIYKDKQFEKTIITNYQYDIKSNNDFLYSKGGIDQHNLLLRNVTIQELGQKIGIHCEIIIEGDKKGIVRDGIVLSIKYLDADDHLIANDIKMILYQ